MDQALALPETILVADLGGTNFAIAYLESLALSNVMQFPCAAHRGPEAAIRSYLEQAGAKPEYALIAVAAPVTGDDIVFTNSHWSFTISGLRRDLGFKDIRVLNDFQAFALALPSLGSNDVFQIGGTEPEIRGTKVAIGVGTGTGMAALVWSPSGGSLSQARAAMRPLLVIARRTLRSPGSLERTVLISPSNGSSRDPVSVRCTKPLRHRRGRKQKRLCPTMC